MLTLMDQQQFDQVVQYIDAKKYQYLHNIMARPHCKSPGQIGGVAWPKGLSDNYTGRFCIPIENLSHETLLAEEDQGWNYNI